MPIKRLTEKDVKKLISKQFGFYASKIHLMKFTESKSGVCEFADFIINGVNYQIQYNCSVGTYKLRIPKHFNPKICCEE